MLHGPRRAVRFAASGVRLDLERVVPWRPHHPKVDCRWAARDLRRRHYTSKTGRSTHLNLKIASWRLPGLAPLRHAHRSRMSVHRVDRITPWSGQTVANDPDCVKTDV